MIIGVPLQDLDDEVTTVEPVNKRQGASFIMYLLCRCDVDSRWEFLNRLTRGLPEDMKQEVEERFVMELKKSIDYVTTCPVCTGIKEPHLVACYSCTNQALSTARGDTAFKTLVSRFVRELQTPTEEA